jgi:hypothetical protein
MNFVAIIGSVSKIKIVNNDSWIVVVTVTKKNTDEFEEIECVMYWKDFKETISFNLHDLVGVKGFLQRSLDKTQVHIERLQVF